MQGSRRQLFPCSCCPGYQNWPEMWSHPANPREHLQHQGARADHTFELIGIQEFAVELHVALAMSSFRDQFANSLAQFFYGERLV